MHWDHLPEHEKVSDIGRLARNHNRAQILAEIEKCELVCANCHAIRTSARREERSGARARDACTRVGVAGFEPAAARPQTECSTRLSYTPSPEG